MREVEKYKRRRVQSARAFGEIDHPPGWSPGFRALSLETVSHVVLQLEWQGSCLVGVIEILDTPAGRMLRDLYLQGKRLGVSSRSWATLNRRAGATFIGDDLDLIAFDYVSEPSTYGALMEPIQERYSEPAADHSALVGEAERAAQRARLVFAKWSSKALGSSRARAGSEDEAAQSLAEAVTRAPKAATGVGGGEGGGGAAAGETPEGPQRRCRVPPQGGGGRGAGSGEGSRWARLWRGGPRGPVPPSLKDIWSSNRVHPAA